MKRKFFLRRMRRFAALVLVPIVLLLVVTFSMAISTQKHQVLQTNARGTEAVETNISLVLDSVLMQNQYMTGMTRTGMVMNKALRRDALSYTDVTYLRSLVTSLTSMVNSYDYLDTVLLYLDGYDRALTSGGVTDLGEEDYAGWHQLYREMPQTSQTSVAKVVRNRGEISEKTFLAVCRRMPKISGCIVALLDVDHLQNMMKALRLSSDQELYLLDQHGELLAATEPVREGSDLEKALLRIPEEESNWQNTWLELDGRRKALSWQIYEEDGLYIVSAVDQSMLLTGLRERIVPLLWMSLAVLAVVIILAYASTSRSFHEIELVLQMFEDAEAGRKIQRPTRKTKDEYDIIMNNILVMFLNNDYLNVQLKEEQYRQQNAELRALQLQINPHFLYNTLQTLDMEARKLDNGKGISRIVGFVSDILKYALSDPQQPVSLREELASLKEYAEIQRYRFGDTFIIYYDIDEEILDANVFRLMLQPVVENSLLHALRGKDGMGYMMVQGHLVRGKIRFHILDNGNGMNEEMLQQLRQKIVNRETRSIGLTNLDRRLRLRYPEENGLQIDSYEGIGTIVSFTVPVI